MIKKGNSTIECVRCGRLLYINGHKIVDFAKKLKNAWICWDCERKIDGK